ncbi:hypothetical protein ABFE25_30530 [Bacillus toyonensis]|uniref:hypothetical protein n=1 Tax=Bacillus toyonensis TaxID=155322 RepID=UPI00321A644E
MEGNTDAMYQADLFNKEFFETIYKYKQPGTTLRVLDVTNGISNKGEINITKNGVSKPILVLKKTELDNHLIILKAEGASDIDLEGKIEKDYSTFAGGELVYQCKKEQNLTFNLL